VSPSKTACPLCEATQREPYRAAAYALGEEPFDLLRCGDCGLVFVHPLPSEEQLRELYDDPEYFEGGYTLGVEEGSYFERGEELVARYEGVVEELEAELGLEAADIFELGAAGGFWLEAARRRGHRVAGVEVSAVASRHAREELGLEVHHGTLEGSGFTAEAFDLVVADNVLEHTTAPGEVLEGLRRLLRPGGHLLIVVPSYVNSVWYRAAGVIPRSFLGPGLAKLLKRDGGDGGPPYHLLEFDRQSLLPWLRSRGFEVLSVRASVPRPAQFFGPGARGVRASCGRSLFRLLDRLMDWGLVPPARLRVVARRI